MTKRIGAEWPERGVSLRTGDSSGGFVPDRVGTALPELPFKTHTLFSRSHNHIRSDTTGQVRGERIHRSTLIGAGVLPLLFQNGQTRADVGLTGAETLTVSRDSGTLFPQMQASLIVERAGRSYDTHPVTVALNNDDEVLRIAHGGLMPLVVRSAFG